MKFEELSKLEQIQARSFIYTGISKGIYVEQIEYELADKLGIELDYQAVAEIITERVNMLRKYHVENDPADYKAIMVGSITQIKQFAYEQMLRSTMPEKITTIKTEQRFYDKQLNVYCERRITTERIKERLADTRYMKVILDCEKAIALLLGMNAPEQQRIITEDDRIGYKGGFHPEMWKHPELCINPENKSFADFEKENQLNNFIEQPGKKRKISYLVDDDENDITN